MLSRKFWVILFLFRIAIAQRQWGKVVFPDEKPQLTIESECSSSDGVYGRCLRARECPAGKFNRLTEDICFFEGRDPVVCCKEDLRPPENFVEIRTTPWQKLSVNVLNRIAWSKRIADKKCMEVQDFFLNLDFMNAVQSSNRQTQDEEMTFSSVNERSTRRKRPPVPDETDKATLPHPLFVGGERSKIRDNPQMAAIGWRTWSGEIDWKCGGSLISSNFVITAAHCTSSRGGAPSIVRVGDLNLLKKGDVASQDFNIAEIFVHPDYKPNENYHDIALIKITPDAKFTEFVKPACLWTEPDIPTKDLTAMGYGTDAFAGARTNELFEGNLTLVDNESCKRIQGPNPQLPYGVIETQLCAKDPLGKADTCQGDSGGPLQFKTKFANYIAQHLVGITSFGEFCAGPSPGVYTRISSYIDWIESIVWPFG